MINDRIRKLSFSATITMLYCNEIIDKPLFDDMEYVRVERNNLIHRIYYHSDLLSMEKVKTMEGLAHKAIHSVSRLRAKI
jgi:hypothetical protein